MVNKNEVDKFDASVDRINTEFENKLNFRYVGPLPCYSFYTIEVKNIDSDDISWAKEKLGLKDTADIKEIKTAYKTAAMKLHPDRNPGKNGAEDEFDNLSTAYKTITAYCIASVGIVERCSFIKNDIDNKTVIVKLKD
ncbi:MAG: DnaJ domain-containing protein [Victivallales bacterium]|nr:DnaJ domain-containing protein [Victivallales bacterium]